MSVFLLLLNELDKVTGINSNEEKKFTLFSFFQSVLFPQDITEILLKVALNTIKQTNIFPQKYFVFEFIM
jgi:hypothetical protein